MPSFPLQEQLIDDVVSFANSPISHPNDLRRIFEGSWSIESDLSLGHIRRVKSEVRKWLSAIISGDLGLTDAPFIDSIFDIRFEGRLGYSVRYLDPRDRDVRTVEDFEHRVKWNWQISEAPLRAVCSLAIASIFEAGFASRVGVCGFESCNRFFVAKRSRGKPREYCFNESCENRRNAARQKEYRKGL